MSAVAEVTGRYEFAADILLADLHANTRDEALREICVAMASKFGWTALQRNELVAAMLRREELGSTGIGRGFAVPHASLAWIDDCRTALAHVPEGIDFQSLDGQPVHTIIAIASPSEPRRLHLQILERIVRSLRHFRPSAPGTN